MNHPKYLTLDDGLYDYVCAHRSDAIDPLLDRLRAETEALGNVSRMLISREQGSFLTLLVAAIQAHNVIELGTFTGYSAICLARGLPENGRLICIDVSEEWTSVARRYWREAALDGRIDLRIGPGAEELPRLDAKMHFDLAFIDADKTGYDQYYEMLLPRLRQDGLILFDNMLARGLVLAPDDDDARAIDALNKKLATDPRVETVLLPLADGLQVCRKCRAAGRTTDS